MSYLFANAANDVGTHLNIALLFGLIVLIGTLGSRLFQKAHIPQVVGCIVVGIFFGDIFKIITTETIENLEPFTMFALGIIGFMIGGELRGDVFKKYGKQFFIILFAQGIGAFVLVAAATSWVAWFLTGSVNTAIAIGLVLGAIASATAPAATVNVLWEFKTRGPLTAAVLAVVALDDGLALLLYRIAATGAQALTDTGHEFSLGTTLLLFGEILGSILLGFAMGILLFYLLRIVKADEKILAFSIGSLSLIVGVSMMLGIDPILPAMTFGITIANVAPRQSKSLFGIVSRFSPPIYTAFFVLAGAHMQFGKITGGIVVMILVYTFFRAFGKIIGCWFGAKISDAPDVVRKYLGICLLPQAGVAIGLAILAGQQFNAELAPIIIMVVMTATFLMEILGPMCVKIGVKKAGEVGLNVTEEDLIKAYSVSDVFDDKPVSITEDLLLQEILEIFSTTDFVYYPVVDAKSRIIGIITIAGIKDLFANQNVAGWLLACDVAEPVQDKVTSDKPLEETFELMRHYDLEHLPVVAAEDDDRLVGVLDYRKANRKISAEVLRRREAADGTALMPA